MNLEKAKKIIDDCDVVVFLTGAGMSADSGLDTFKSTTNSRNVIKPRGVSYAYLTTEEAFKKKNKLAWAFHGLRFNSYKQTQPHDGYHKLLKLAKQKKDHFVVTSNIDSAHHKVGFENVYEIHGRLKKVQCIECNHLWEPGEDTFFDVDLKTYTLKNEAPKCECGGNTRPNVVFFGYDKGFDKTETKEQSRRFTEFMQKYDKGHHKIALIEIGAGESVTTIRTMSEFIHERVPGATLIRINPQDTYAPDDRVVVVKMNAKEAIEHLSK
jgi:NAD-dependent SIR2 family protein deacetylase